MNAVGLISSGWIRLATVSTWWCSVNSLGWRTFTLAPQTIAVLNFGAVAPSSVQNGSWQQRAALMPTGNWPFINSFNLICILTGWFRTGDSLNGFIRVHSVAIDSNDDNNRIPIKDLIDKIIIHPQWNRTTRNSDIALIRLKKDFPYESKYINFQSLKQIYRLLT